LVFSPGWSDPGRYSYISKRQVIDTGHLTTSVPNMT
jgi:hypothetical protein